MIEIQESCGIIPYTIKDNKLHFLLVKGRHNHWGFPKGHIENGETCLQTALREFEEETGIPVEFIEIENKNSIKDSYFFYLKGKKVKKYVNYFVGKLKKNFERYIKPQEGEIYEVEIVPVEKVNSYLEFKSIKIIFEKVLSILKQQLGKQ